MIIYNGYSFFTSGLVDFAFVDLITVVDLRAAADDFDEHIRRIRRLQTVIFI